MTKDKLRSAVISMLRDTLVRNSSMTSGEFADAVMSLCCKEAVDAVNDLHELQMDTENKEATRWCRIHNDAVDLSIEAIEKRLKGDV